MKQPPIGAQMYTVRNAAAQNLLTALERVANIGYAGVELAGLFGWPPQQVADHLNSLELTCISAHVPLENLLTNLSQEIQAYTAIGARYLVCPWLSPELRESERNYRTLANQLNQIGQQCQASGLQLCYHHHDFELVTFNGQRALDLLLTETDPAYVQLELDTYWLKFGGVDPAEYIRRWPNRVPLVHLKDMSQTQPPTFAEVGTGILDWSSIFGAAPVCNVQWYIVEQDTCPGDPFDSLKLSWDNLENLIT